MSADPDQLDRFLFERSGVRGALVHLDATWQAVLARHAYPPAVRSPLGEAMAAVLLLTATLKFEGTLILQLQGQGPVTSLVAQATHRRTVRGLARWHGEVAPGPLDALFGPGQLVLTLQVVNGEPYQGVVPLVGERLATALEGYFAASEQLPTRLWLAADGHRASGLMLQRLPVSDADPDAWGRVCCLADTVQGAELTALPAQVLLRRLFHHEDVRLFEPEPVAFRCTCSRQRIAGTLRALGRAEINGIIAERGAVEVTCEFCNRVYRFDAVDVGELFADGAAGGTPTRH